MRRNRYRPNASGAPSPRRGVWTCCFAVAIFATAAQGCVDRPNLCGGLEEILRGFKRRQGELNPDRFLRYLMRLREPALTKRVGFLLELAGYGEPRVLRELEHIAGRVKRYVPLDTTRRDRTGARNKRWELVINADIDELLEVGKT